MAEKCKCGVERKCLGPALVGKETGEGEKSGESIISEVCRSHYPSHTSLFRSMSELCTLLFRPFFGHFFFLFARPPARAFFAMRGRAWDDRMSRHQAREERRAGTLQHPAHLFLMPRFRSLTAFDLLVREPSPNRRSGQIKCG